MTAQNGGASNQALWLRSRRGRWAVGPAAIPTAGAGEIVVRVRAVAVNPVDAVPGVARTIIAPWRRYPTVLGSDVDGDVVAVGADADRFFVGDRILGHALSFEKRHNRAAEGGFQNHTVLKAHMASPIPAHVSYEQAAVVPLGVSAAACGLFETFLPEALAGGTFRPAPPPRVIGTGLDCIPDALTTLRRGVSASKIVVTVEP